MLGGLLILVIITSCTSITYRSPDGASVTIERFGYDTKIGSLTASRDPQTGAVNLSVENYDSQAAAIALAREALAAIVAGAKP